MRLRILTYNICEGGAGRLSTIAEVMQRAECDAIALIEASDLHSAAQFANMLQLRLVFGEANNPQGHIAWLSRLPVVQSVNHRCAELAKTVLEIEVATNPARHPWLRLDYVFASPELASCLRGCDVTREGTATASDHLPRWVEFE